MHRLHLIGRHPLVVLRPGATAVLALALATLPAHAQRAVRLEGEASSFTAGDRPSHAFWTLVNDGARPVRVEVLRVTQAGAALPISRVWRDDREVGRSFEVPPRSRARVSVWLTSGPPPFEYELTVRAGGQALRATARVQLAFRHPVRP